MQVRRVRTITVIALAFVGGTLALIGSPAAASATVLRWGQPIRIDPTRASLPNGSVPDAVSCASPSFCVAADTAGYVMTWNGSRWSTPLHVDTSANNEITSVSCPSANFCAAVDFAGDVITFNGTTWSALKDIDDGLYFVSVSCTSAAFCAAVGNQGGGPNQILTFNGTSWSTPQSLDESNFDDVQALSCSSPSFCLAVDEGGYALTFNDGTWGAPVQIAPGYALERVSCTSPSFCATIGNPIHSGREVALTFDGVSWSAPTGIDNGQLRNALCFDTGAPICEDLSCPTASFCVAVDIDGDAITWNGRTWSRPTMLPTPHDFVQAVGCGGVSLCWATYANGDAIEYGPSPVLSDLRLSRTRFSAPVGTVVSYRDTDAALTTLSVMAKLQGVVHHGKCVAPASDRTSGSAGKACRRLVLIGSFSHRDRPGLNQVRLAAHTLRRTLATGDYLLEVSATLDHITSQVVARPFVIIAA